MLSVVFDLPNWAPGWTVKNVYPSHFLKRVEIIKSYIFLFIDISLFACDSFIVLFNVGDSVIANQLLHCFISSHDSD